MVLRLMAGIVASLAFATTAVAQNTTLTVNGQSASDNSTTVDVVAGTRMRVEIENAGQPLRPFGLFAALAEDGSNNGWYLAASGPDKPLPIFTGISTSVVESDYGVDIFPDRVGSPFIKLDANGRVVINFNVPSGLSGTVYLQAVVQPSGGGSTDVSNGVQVNLVAKNTAARLLVSQASGAVPTNLDAVQFGVLEFSNGNPTTATFTAAPSLSVSNKPDTISMGDMSDWISHFTATGTDKGRDVDWRSPIFGPAINNDNHEYARISLPALPGADGQLGTGDDIPPRDLMRCYDNVSQEGYYLVINKGANPNTPGVDFFAIPGTRKKDTVNANLNSWKIAMQVSPDGSRAASIYDDSSAAINPQMFLFATDGSLPFLDASSLPVATVDVTPSGTTKFNFNNNVRTTIFTNNRLWLTKDTGATQTNPNMTLYTVDIRAQQPVPQQVTIAQNGNYGPAAAMDTIPDRGMLVPRGGGDVMCFLCGNSFALAGTTIFQDHVAQGDWFAVRESAPTSAVNLTKFRLYGPASDRIPKLYVPGDSYTGTSGYAAISADGTALGFVAHHANERNGTVNSISDDEEVYFCSTLDSDGNGEGNDANTLFDLPVTTQARIDTSANGNGLDSSFDLFVASATELYFFYGLASSATNREMDLFRYLRSTDTFTNVTNPSATFPITAKGAVNPEGYFVSPNGEHFFFARGNGITGTETNLIGVDRATGRAFNVTGNEYAGPSTGDTNNPGPLGDNFNWHLSYAGGDFPSVCYFALPLVSIANNWQIWAFDANFPTAAVQLTNNNSGATIENVDSLTGNPFGLGCAWWWERSTAALADLQYQDLVYGFRDVLTETVTPFTSSATLSGIDFVRAATDADATDAAPPALVVSIGDALTPLDNPSDAEMYYFSLDGTRNYDFDSVAGVNAPGHQMGTLTGFVQVYFADVQ